MFIAVDRALKTKELRYLKISPLGKRGFEDDKLNNLPSVGVCDRFCCRAEAQPVAVRVCIKEKIPDEDSPEMWTGTAYLI